MNIIRREASFGAHRSRGFASTEKIVIVVAFAVLAMAAVPTLQRHRERERLTDGVSALARYASEMERFYLEHGRYGEAQSGCGVPPPANTHFLSFSCRTDGESFIAAVRGMGALAGYEYVVDASSQPRRTVRFGGATVNASCWLRSASSCYS